MEGIIRWIRLKFDKKSGEQAADQMQDAVVKGTDPKKPVDNIKAIEDQVTDLGKQMKKLIPLFSAGFVVRSIVRATAENEQALAQLDNIIRLTGEGAGFTTEQLAQLSTEMARSSTTASASVQGGLTRLLAYTNIQGDEFLRAAQAALDMSEVLGIDMTSAAETLGRALDDPINGLGALSRQGFKFGDSQKALIDEMVRTNDIAGAQALILEVIEGNYEGAAKAARQTLGGALRALKNEWGDQIALSGNASSAIVDFVNLATDSLPKVRDFLDRLVGGIQILAIDAAVGVARLELAIAKLFRRNVAQAEQNLKFMREAAEAERNAVIEAYEGARKAQEMGAGPLAGFEFDRGKEIAAAIAATQNLINQLEHERDALQYSRWELIQKSQEYLNATPAQRAYIEELFNEAEMIRETNRANAEREAQAKREEAERERRTQGVLKHIAALDAELASLDMSERQIFETSEAFRDAEQGQREYMLSIYDAIEARREQIQAEKDAANEAEQSARQLQMAAEDNARRMVDAYQPFFDGMAMSMMGLGNMTEWLMESFHGLGAEIVAQMIEGKAEMSMAEAVSALAQGTWPPNPAALKSAALHMSAAAAFRAISARGSATASNMGAATSAAEGAARRSADTGRKASDINIYIDGVDPRNPRHQALISRTANEYRERTGGKITVQGRA
jgi:hypothetical protein